VSLSIFVRKKAPEVAIVQWFRSGKSSIEFATGPLIQMEFQAFRRIGFEFVQRHPTDYFLLRIPEENIKPVFRPGDAKKVMKGGRALQIHRLESGQILFRPQEIRKYSLAHIRRLGKEFDITIDRDSTAELFWKSFDTALAACEPDEIAI